MNPQVFRVPASAAKQKAYEIKLREPAQGILVHSGAPGVRIYFDEKSEAFIGEKSVEAITGLALGREYSKLYVIANDDVEVPDIIVEALACAPAVVAHLGDTVIRYRREFDDFAIAAAEGASTELVPAVAWNAEKSGDNRTGWYDALYLGGALTCDQPWIARVFSILPNAKRAQVASLHCDAVDFDNAYSASFETGWERNHSSSATNKEFATHGVLLPVDMPWTLEIEIVGGADAVLSGVVYART